MVSEPFNPQGLKCFPFVNYDKQDGSQGGGESPNGTRAWCLCGQGNEIDEYKAPIYGNDGKKYNESNILEENNAAIMPDKIMASKRKWQQD